ncbi:unnamed protein product [Aphis gossypii]|uniref:Uncharacterized protein n=1 Tax=Aphis gossypii TaxID=80765 RepID=A0A9P0NJ78_APHGO|nr:unnamed protein product [Aphis gossypii]
MMFYTYYNIHKSMKILLSVFSSFVICSSLSSRNYVTERWLSFTVLMGYTDDVQHSCTHPWRRSGTPRDPRSETAGGRLRTAKRRSHSTSCSGGERSRSADVSPLSPVRRGGSLVDGGRYSEEGRLRVAAVVGRGLRGCRSSTRFTHARARTQSYRRLCKRARG